MPRKRTKQLIDQDKFNEEIEIINNIEQTISDSEESQIFVDWDIEKLRVLQKQSHQLTKIIQNACEVQKNLSKHAAQSARTDQFLIQFYQFACSVFKQIGLLEKTADDSLIKISTVYQTIKKNYEKTKNSVNTKTFQQYEHYELLKSRSHNLPLIPKIYEYKNYYSTLKGFEEISQQSQCPSMSSIERDFRDIEIQIFKRIEESCSIRKKYDERILPEQQLLVSQNFDKLNLPNIKIVQSHQKQSIKSSNYQVIAIEQEKEEKSSELFDSKGQFSKSSQAFNNSYTGTDFQINISNLSDQQAFDNLLLRVLSRKPKRKANI